MNTTSYSSESAQSAMPAKITAGLSRTRSRLFLRTRAAFPVSRCLYEAGPARPAPIQTAAFPERVPLAVESFHPFPNRGFTDLEFLRDLHNCMAAVNDQRNRVLLVLRGKASPGGTHRQSPCVRELRSPRGVHQTGHGPHRGSTRLS